MKKWFLYGILTFLPSCGQKFYTKQQYSFYDEKFILETNSVLKTDGVYILEQVWSSNKIQNINRKSSKVYKFYDSGHVNFSVQDSTISNQNYIKYVKEQIAISNKKKNTLFEGYYKIKGDKIIIQNVNTPLRQFYYTYGFLEDNKLKIVKETIEGNGKFDDKFFTKFYVETYKFIKIENLDSLDKPNW